MASIRVLMVDDQPVILAALRQMLAHEADLELREVSDPSRAMIEALAFEPAVILQDLVMDGLDGISLLKRYRAHPSLVDVPVVMLSAAEEPETKVDAFRNGANDYVVKLPSALELAARIRHHGRAFHNARQREQAFQALLESRAALQARQTEIERQKAQLEAQARQLEAVNRELADSALSDALTGLRNRRYLREFLERGSGEAERMPGDTERRGSGAPGRLSFFLFDLDHFKQINDRHGHDVGDAVLVEVARRLRQTLRQGDAAMRWGGEEFMVVARGLSDDAAAALAERMLRAVGSQPVPVPLLEPLTISASLGYANWPWPGRDAPAQVDHHLAIGLADAGAYLAKLDGRNRGFGILPGPDPSFRRDLASISLGPGVLRPEDGRGVQLVPIAGPARIAAHARA
ncbi:MAG: diguanylate cyclase [Rhodanobacteraceae bacterium]|nr:diguanylate cyclase [Rhodanobacteraceae bacterium]